MLLSSVLSDVGEGLDGSVVRDRRLEHVEHAGLVDKSRTSECAQNVTVVGID